ENFSTLISKTNDSLESVDISLHVSHTYLTLSAVICIEDPEAHIQKQRDRFDLRGFYGFGRTESVVGGKKSKRALGSPAVVADCANPSVEREGYFCRSKSGRS